MMYWLAQLFGFFGLIAMIYGLFKKTKKDMLLYVVFNGLFFGIEYLLLGAWPAMLSNFIGILRTIFFRKKDEDSKYNKLYILVVFIIIYVVIGFFTFNDNIVNLLPIFAEIVYILSLWQKETLKIRIGTLIMVIMWLIYDIIVLAYPSMITDIIVLVSTIISIITVDFNLRLRKK